MPVCFVFSCVMKNGEFCLGNKHKLLYHLKADMKFFKDLTLGSTVVMGRKTWDSLPNKPLKGRKNIVVSRNVGKFQYPYTEFLSFQETLDLIIGPGRYFVIGGVELFASILQSRIPVDRMYITHITPKNVKNMEYDTSMDISLLRYKISGSSEKKTEDGVDFRHIILSRTAEISQETKYLKTMNEIMNTSSIRKDRTGVGVKSIFGKTLRFNIETSIPLLTTKKISFKNIVEELLWILRGETDSKILEAKGVGIWKGNTSKEFLHTRGLDYPEGELGPMYGYQMRNFGGKYPDKSGGFDQLKNAEHLLKTDPFSRRIVITLLNPPEYSKSVLVPCHHFIQFYTELINGKKYLSIFFNMRSSDFALAGCYNIVSYSILCYIMAKRCGMVPKEIIYSAVDCHIYTNHFSGVAEQLKTNLRVLPQLHLDNSIKTKDWSEITRGDFQVVGYFPNKAIRIDMAV